MSVTRPLRLATAGGVGDGRSTLIGRLLLDLSLTNGRVDAYDAVRATGALTVIDEATDQALGAGLVR